MLPASNAGVEADFLNSPWVALFNPRVILLNPRWTVALRAELAEIAGIHFTSSDELHNAGCALRIHAPRDARCGGYPYG